MYKKWAVAHIVFGSKIPFLYLDHCFFHLAELAYFWTQNSQLPLEFEIHVWVTHVRPWILRASLQFYLEVCLMLIHRRYAAQFTSTWHTRVLFNSFLGSYFALFSFLLPSSPYDCLVFVAVVVYHRMTKVYLATHQAWWNRLECTSEKAKIGSFSARAQKKRLPANGAKLCVCEFVPNEWNAHINWKTAKTSHSHLLRVPSFCYRCWSMRHVAPNHRATGYRI